MGGNVEWVWEPVGQGAVPPMGVSRMEVPGGWLYATRIEGKGIYTTFVPMPEIRANAYATFEGDLPIIEATETDEDVPVLGGGTTRGEAKRVRSIAIGARGPATVHYVDGSTESVAVEKLERHPMKGERPDGGIPVTYEGSDLLGGPQVSGGVWVPFTWGELLALNEMRRFYYDTTADPERGAELDAATEKLKEATTKGKGTRDPEWYDLFAGVIVMTGCLLAPAEAQLAYEVIRGQTTPGRPEPHPRVGTLLDRLRSGFQPKKG